MNIKQCILFTAIAFSFAACSEDNDLGNVFEPKTYNVLGKVEKGPFISGSNITIQPMDGNLQVLGSLYSATIQDNLGNFSFGSKLFEAPYAELMANGYFFNEVTGELSSGTLNLRALVDLSDETTVNVNLLTHLKYQRIQNLIADGMKFREANKQAQKELFTAFGLQKYAAKDASTFSISGGTDESAALVAISSLLIIGRSEAEMTEYLARLCREFGENGKFESGTLQQIREDKDSLKYQLSAARENVIKRYKELGLEVEVKELGYFIDWDDDGIAGNEILQDGQEVKLEVTELNVPNEGGDYAIGISSPIPLFLTSIHDDESKDELGYSDEIYENRGALELSIEKSINQDKLMIKVPRLNSRTDQSETVTIYDCLGNVVGEVKVTQEGYKSTAIPKLGRTGEELVTNIASRIAYAFSDFNLVEQCYHYNKEMDLVSQYIYNGSIFVFSMWQDFYQVNAHIIQFKNIDYWQLGVYQDYLNVFSAMNYYYMTVAWQDVPYIRIIGSSYMERTSMHEIFSDLKASLEKGIDNFEEKRNESLSTDLNEYFFLSKDVARILLADIYMYEGEYIQAEELLGKVISNGFYELDASNYNNKETITNLYNNGSSRETIFAIRSVSHTDVNISLEVPTIVPLMTYTDVVLSYAESLYKNGKTSEAESQLQKVVVAKHIGVTGENTLEKIKDARLQLMLYTNTNFAFMKRNGFAQEVYGVEEYRLLLPIPSEAIAASPEITQNPGY